MPRTKERVTRVKIIDRDHPWYGELGYIVGSFDHPTLDYTVELASGDYPGHRVAVSANEIEDAE
jgi:hypothetical protein